MRWTGISHLSTSITEAMRERRLLYPIVEIIHILGIIVLVWSAALLDFRLLGLSRQLSVAQLSRYVLPWARLSVLAIVPAGVLMFASNATSLKPGRSRQFECWATIAFARLETCFLLSRLNSE
jgi:hypothetical protein